MVKVTKDPIGMFTRMSQTLAKQRTDPTATKSTSSQTYTSQIRDRIEISSPVKSGSDVQALTKEMTGQSFKSVKEYGKFFLDAYAKIKGDKG